MDLTKPSNSTAALFQGRIEPHEFIAQSETVVEVALKWIEERPRPYFLVVLAIDPRAPYLPPRNHDAAQFPFTQRCRWPDLFPQATVEVQNTR